MTLDGVLVVDKPAGMTSHDVVGLVRRLLRSHATPGKVKVGHAGTLDPDATGVLVVAVGRATRLVPFLQASRKTYDARMQLGRTTSTLDASGEVLTEADASGLDEQAVCEALKGFVGRVEQVPPMVSAVKVGGERLYAKARRGEDVERPVRTIEVHDIVLEDFLPGPKAELAFLVTCSRGTYVRTLAADIGERLGVGAHLVSLRRLASGRFTVESAVTLSELEALAPAGRLGEVLVAPATAMADYPVVHLDDPDVRAVGHGKSLPPTGQPGPVRAVDAHGNLVAVVEDRDALARPLVVLMPA